MIMKLSRLVPLLADIFDLAVLFSIGTSISFFVELWFLLKPYWLIYIESDKFYIKTRLKVVCTSAGSRNAKHFCQMHNWENVRKVSAQSFQPFKRTCGRNFFVTDFLTYWQTWSKWRQAYCASKNHHYLLHVGYKAPRFESHIEGEDRL